MFMILKREKESLQKIEKKLQGNSNPFWPKKWKVECRSCQEKCETKDEMRRLINRVIKYLALCLVHKRGPTISLKIHLFLISFLEWDLIEIRHLLFSFLPFQLFCIVEIHGEPILSGTLQKYVVFCILSCPFNYFVLLKSTVNPFYLCI